MRKWGLREVKELAQGHTASKWFKGLEPGSCRHQGLHFCSTSIYNLCIHSNYVPLFSVPEPRQRTSVVLRRISFPRIIQPFFLNTASHISNFTFFSPPSDSFEHFRNCVFQTHRMMSVFSLPENLKYFHLWGHVSN